MLQWILGISAVVIWVIPITWYFRGDVVELWRARNDKWFKSDV